MKLTFKPICVAELSTVKMGVSRLWEILRFCEPTYLVFMIETLNINLYECIRCQLTCSKRAVSHGIIDSFSESYHFVKVSSVHYETRFRLWNLQQCWSPQDGELTHPIFVSGYPLVLACPRTRCEDRSARFWDSHP